MDMQKAFYSELESAMTVTLATCGDGRVTMRAVSPVVCGGEMLFFTARASTKFRQLETNPRCCVGAGLFFAEAEARFCGPAMRPENAALREVYSKKFPGAFDEGVEFGGRDSEFILLRFTRLSGWAFEEGKEDGVPTLPFDMAM